MTDARDEMIVNDNRSVADPGNFCRGGGQTFRKNDKKKGKRGRGRGLQY